MATTAIWCVKDGLDNVIRYVAKSSKTWRGQYDRAAKYHALENVLQYTADQMKTEKQFYVSGLNCDEQPDAAQKQFEITKRRFKKEGGIVCFHGYQSFAPGEVTPEIAHAIGIEAVKATIAIIKETIAIIIAGGWVAVLIIIFVCIVAIVVGFVLG